MAGKGARGQIGVEPVFQSLKNGCASVLGMGHI